MKTASSARGLRLSRPPHPVRHIGPRVARLAEPALAAELRRHLPGLLALPNVSHVGLGRKIAGGQPTGEIGAVVYVEAKQDMPRGAAVPKRLGLDGGPATLATDVVEGSAARLLGLRAGDGLQGFDRQTGICSLTLAAGERRLAITCAHVVVDLDRGVAGPAVWVTGGAAVTAGQVITRSAFDAGEIRADGAVIELGAGIASEPWRLLRAAQPINALGRFTAGESTDYFYVTPTQTVHCALPVWVPGGAGQSIVRFDGQQRPVGDFWKLRVGAGGPARPGHSGALVVRTGIGGYVATGIVFAGRPDPDAAGFAAGQQEVWVFPIQVILDALGIVVPAG